MIGTSLSRYPSSDVAPPCGTRDKNLEQTGENDSDKTARKIAVQRTCHRRLEDHEQHAKDQHRGPSGDDGVDRPQDRAADEGDPEEASGTSYKESGQEHHGAMNFRTPSVRQSDP